jgi:hypothetical protein
MTFFNKKTEVMQIEMTPYGRYLYSIGKFKPHSYEFVDDDVLYRTSGSTETQESAHSRILNETPKLKINRAFQDEAEMLESPATISDKRVMTRKMNQRQSNLYSLGRSSYSGSNVPLIQATMLQGSISGSQMTFSVAASNHSGHVSDGGEILIPQIDIDVNFTAHLRNTLDIPDDYDGMSVQSSTFDDGTYIDIRYVEPIIHIKEFNSFYEKENFEIEAFKVSGSSGDQTLIPLKMQKKVSAIVNDLLVDPMLEDIIPETNTSPSDFMDYFFEIQADSEIPPEELCKAVDRLEINSQFLDEELICPDQRTDRFDIYSTRVDPEDLEDCD